MHSRVHACVHAWARAAPTWVQLWPAPPCRTHLHHARVLLLVALDLHQDLEPLKRRHRRAAPAARQRSSGQVRRQVRRRAWAAARAPAHPLVAPAAAFPSPPIAVHPGRLHAACCACMRPPPAPGHSHSACHAAGRQALADLGPCQAALVHLPMLALRHDGRLLQWDTRAGW